MGSSPIPLQNGAIWVFFSFTPRPQAFGVWGSGSNFGVFWGPSSAGQEGFRGVLFSPRGTRFWGRGGSLLPQIMNFLGSPPPPGWEVYGGGSSPQIKIWGGLGGSAPPNDEILGFLTPEKKILGETPPPLKQGVLGVSYSPKS